MATLLSEAGPFVKHLPSNITIISQTKDLLIPKGRKDIISEQRACLSSDHEI